MKKSVSVLFMLYSFVLLLVVVNVNSLPPPAAYSVNLPTTPTVFPLIKVIGAPDFTSVGDSSSPTSSTLGSVSQLVSLASGQAGNNSIMGQGGLIATDSDNFKRALFFANPIPVSGDSADVVFGATDFNNQGVTFNPQLNGGGFVDVSHNLNGTIVFSDGQAAYVYTSYNNFPGNFGYYPPAANNPVVTIGRCSSCTYPVLTSSASSVTDRSNLYVSSKSCAIVYTWRLSSLTSNNAEPYLFYGQTGASQCGANLCTATTAGVTCLTPGPMAIDCYGGLWITDTASRTILHFPPGVNQADWALNISATPTHISFGSGNRCNYMAVVNNYIGYVVFVNYTSAGVPTAASAQFSFGNKASPTSTSQSTSSIGFVNTLTWDKSSPDYMWVYDQGNNRLVYLTPFGQAAASQSLVPSTTPSASITPSTTRSLTTTASTSITPSRTPSNTPTSSSSASIGLTPSATPNAPSPSPAITGTFNDTSSYFTSSPNPGSSSCLSSWLSLLF